MEQSHHYHLFFQAGYLMTFFPIQTMQLNASIYATHPPTHFSSFSFPFNQMDLLLVFSQCLPFPPPTTAAHHHQPPPPNRSSRASVKSASATQLLLLLASSSSYLLSSFPLISAAAQPPLAAVNPKTPTPKTTESTFPG